ncbi:LppU/SCO3897 family protein [Nocardia panacis]|uniref:LppU/SCO3897 family protein n=1 Tax=Nocardia panacis TaxID=2340916 RepID=UPI0019398677|nr:hypothetical protein [Nocardia panacis]
MKIPGARLLARIALALVALAAVAIAVTGCSAVKEASKSDTAKAKVGDCINVIKASESDSKTEPVDCSSEKALYKVTKTFDKKSDCAAGNVGYDETLNNKTLAYLCLTPNFKQGKCYADVGNTGYKLVDCTAAEASFKIIQRIDGQADELACGTDSEKFLTIDDPKTTFCLAKPKA